MQIEITPQAADHIRSHGGRAIIDLLQHST